MDLYDEIVRLRKLGQKCAVATIVQVNGSIPSFESAKILVREDGSFMGTVGGGCVEAEVWNAAREVIETEKPRHLSFSLGQDAAYDEGLICGGQLNIFVEPVIPQPRAFIFGGGHVSKGISKIATLAGFSTSIIDNRDDMRVLRWAVNTTARYIAMIGSKRKTISVVHELEKEGIPREAFDKVFAPMGLEIGAELPEEIAISVVAEMIAVRRAPDTDWRQLSKSIFAHD